MKYTKLNALSFVTYLVSTPPDPQHWGICKYLETSVSNNFTYSSLNVVWSKLHDGTYSVDDQTGANVLSST